MGGLRGANWIILTSSSKPFRLGKVEVLEVLKDRRTLCGSKGFATLIA
jgi:hypothetical protein